VSVLLDPADQLDAWLTGLFDGAPLLAALAIAFALGLRHALDPDHLVAVTSLVAADGGGVRGASRLGASWGAGHAVTLIAIGGPLILLTSELPGWLESGAEIAVGVVIVVLAIRLGARRPPGRIRSPHQAFAIGTLHGLAGTGAVVVLLIAGMGSQDRAVAALAVFAPMSIISMTLCTSAFAWVLTRPAVERRRRSVALPALAAFGLAFGLWYLGAA
jgi:hypothetical protein